MADKKITVAVSKTIGRVSAKVTAANRPKYLLILAHGAGAGMDHPFMKALADELTKHSVTTVRFNFPFTELKKGRPDAPPVAMKTDRKSVV